MARKSILAICFSWLLMFSGASAHDLHRPDLDSWFSGLKTPGGGYCCAFADGTTLVDADWQSKGDHYQVRMDGRWYDVPPGAVLTTPNRYGPAIVWRYKLNAPDGATSDWVIRCFIPGAGT